MARKPNSAETVQITISVTTQVRAWLERLCEYGLYGKNPAESAAILLSEKLRELKRTEGSGLHPSDRLESAQA